MNLDITGNTQSLTALSQYSLPIKEASLRPTRDQRVRNIIDNAHIKGDECAKEDAVRFCTTIIEKLEAPRRRIYLKFILPHLLHEKDFSAGIKTRIHESVILHNKSRALSELFRALPSSADMSLVIEYLKAIEAAKMKDEGIIFNYVIPLIFNKNEKEKYHLEDLKNLKSVCEGAFRENRQMDYLFWRQVCSTLR